MYALVQFYVNNRRMRSMNKPCYNSHTLFVFDRTLQQKNIILNFKKLLFHIKILVYQRELYKYK